MPPTSPIMAEDDGREVAPVIALLLLGVGGGAALTVGLRVGTLTVVVVAGVLAGGVGATTAGVGTPLYGT